VVADRAQIGLHTEIGALESAGGGKTGGINLVERVLTGFVYYNVEPNRLCHAMQGELSRDCPSVIVLLYKFGTDKRHLRKLGDVEPIGALKIPVARRKLCLQAVCLNGHGQFAGGDIVGIEADVSSEIAKQTDHLREPKMVDCEQNVGV